jgi:hypothetical protein
MVGSECDIVESFSRHTLSYVDHIYFHIHNSYDSTSEIVQRLIEEGLGISFKTLPDVAFQRERMGDALVRERAACFDYILPLDVDEFIVAPDRSTLESELESTPNLGLLRVRWLSYVPTIADDPKDPNPVTRIQHRLRSPHWVSKVFFPADVLRFDDVYLADGNHDLLSKIGRDIPQHTSKRIFIAHFPVRSSQQLISKVRIGAAARLLNPDFTEKQSPHWRSLATDPLLRSDLSIQRLSEYALDYLGSRERDIIASPLQTPAKATKYHSQAEVDALERLSRFVARLLERPDVVLQLRQTLTGPSDTVDRTNLEREGVLVAEVETARRIIQKQNVRIRNLERRLRMLQPRTWAIVLIVALIVCGAAILLQ